MVLNYLGDFYPNQSVPMDVLGRKVAMLLALISGQRIQTLAKIKIDHIIISSKAIQIFVSEEMKTTSPKGVQPCLHIPFFSWRTTDMCGFNLVVLHTADIRT